MTMQLGFIPAAASSTPDDLFRPTAALAETFRRLDVGALVPLVSGQLSLTAIVLPAGALVTSITMFAYNATGTPTHQWFALFNAGRARLAATSDDTNVAWAGGALKTLALAAPHGPVAGGLYYLGVCVVAGTPPALWAAGAEGFGSLQVALNSLAPILGGKSDSGLTTPASCPATAADITPTGEPVYAYVS